MSGDQIYAEYKRLLTQCDKACTMEGAFPFIGAAVMLAAHIMDNRDYVLFAKWKVETPEAIEWNVDRRIANFGDYQMLVMMTGDSRYQWQVLCGCTPVQDGVEDTESEARQAAIDYVRSR